MALGAVPRHILDVHLHPKRQAVADVILAVILSRLVRSQNVLQKQDTVEVVDFSAGLACFSLAAVLATLSPALRALHINPSTTSSRDTGCSPKNEPNLPVCFTMSEPHAGQVMTLDRILFDLGVVYFLAGLQPAQDCLASNSWRQRYFPKPSPVVTSV
jgi:hypothetical protein